MEATEPDQKRVLPWNHFEWEISWCILLENMTICVPASHTKIKFTLQPQEQKSGRRVIQYSHTLYGGYCTQLKESFPSESFEWEISWCILLENMVIFVHTAAAKSSLLFNRRNKKVVGGQHNVLIYYVEAAAPDQKRVLLCNSFN